MGSRSKNNSSDMPHLQVTRDEATQRIQALLEEGYEIKEAIVLTAEDLKKAEAKESTWVDYCIELLGRTFDNASEARKFEKYGKHLFSPNPPLVEEVKYFFDRMDDALIHLKSLLRRIPLIPESREEQPSESSHEKQMTLTNPSADVLPLRVLKEAITAVPAVRFALGIAGVAAAVSIVAGFGFDYRVAVFGTLIMIGLMFVLVAFSSFAKDSKKSIRPFAFTLSWAFLILTITTSLLLVTSYFFSWPKNLESFVAQNYGQPKSSPWKVKVYDFDNVLSVAREKELGQRFSSRLLDYLLKKQLDVTRGSMGDPYASLFLIPTRGNAPEDDLADVNKLAPVVMVYGYIEQREDGLFIVQMRVSRIGADLRSTPLLNESYTLPTDQAQMENVAQHIGETIYLLISKMLDGSDLAK